MFVCAKGENAHCWSFELTVLVSLCCQFNSISLTLTFFQLFYKGSFIIIPYEMTTGVRSPRNACTSTQTYTCTCKLCCIYASLGSSMIIFLFLFFRFVVKYDSLGNFCFGIERNQ